jgi:phosphoribosylanthranilate isomerase
MRIRVKICGVTNRDDAIAAARSGADAVGMIFAPSPRRISIDEAAGIVRALAPFVCPVGVFVDAPAAEVIETARVAGLHTVQLSGSESPEYLDELAGLDIIKCVHVAAAEDIEKAALYPNVKILLDTASPQAAGGTGEAFPWEYAAKIASERPVILAGGLKPENVARAIQTVRPWGVDVSSGVEARPAHKDLGKIREFMKGVRSAQYD